MNDNPYAAPPTLSIERDTATDDFDRALLFPAVWVVTAFAVCFTLLFVFVLFYVILMAYRFSFLMNGIGFSAWMLLPIFDCVMAASWAYATYCTWRYQRSLRRWTYGAESWQQYALTHRRLWQSFLILAAVMVGIILMRTIRPLVIGF